MASCRYCGKKILWRSHVNSGKKAPIDAEPVSNGNVVLVGDKQYAIAVGSETPANAKRFLNHFSTCDKKPKREGR